MTEKKELKEIVIPRERAVFRMDANGSWHNSQGRFRLKRIIDHFNSSIRRDENGYYVTQVNGDFLEKVYFSYEDTALFVVDVEKTGEDTVLYLNNGEKLSLLPETLVIRKDSLYIENGDELIKFTDRSLMKLSRWMEGEEDRYLLNAGGKIHEIRVEDQDLPR